MSAFNSALTQNKKYRQHSDFLKINKKLLINNVRLSITEKQIIIKENQTGIYKIVPNANRKLI